MFVSFIVKDIKGNIEHFRQFTLFPLRLSQRLGIAMFCVINAGV